MRITYTYRGQETVLCNNFVKPFVTNECSVKFNQQAWTDGNKKVFHAEIQPHELLNTAKQCLKALSEISGCRYAVAVSSVGEQYKIMEQS